MGAVAASVMMPSVVSDPTSISHWPSPQSATTSPASLMPIWRQPGTVHLGARSQCSFIWSHWLSSQTSPGLPVGKTVTAGGEPPSGVTAGTGGGVSEVSGPGTGVSEASGLAVGVSDASGLAVGVSDASGLAVGVSDPSGLAVGVPDSSGGGVTAGVSEGAGTAVGVTEGSVEGAVSGPAAGMDGSGFSPAPLSDVVKRSPSGIGVGVGNGTAVSSANASNSGRAHRQTHRQTQTPRICRFLTERMLNLLLEAHKVGAPKAPPTT